MSNETWAPVACTNAIACPVLTCKASPGERCATDRPLHFERWDAWRAMGFESLTAEVGDGR